MNFKFLFYLLNLILITNFVLSKSAEATESSKESAIEAEYEDMQSGNSKSLQQQKHFPKITFLETQRSSSKNKTIKSLNYSPSQQELILSELDLPSEEKNLISSTDLVPQNKQQNHTN